MDNKPQIAAERPHEHGQPKTPMSPITLHLSILVALSGAHLLNDLMIAVIPAMLPLLQTAFQLNYAQLGMVVMVSNLMSSFIQPVFGYLTDRKPVNWLLPVGLFTVGLGLALVAIVPSYGWLLFAVALSGLGSASFHPEASKTAHLASNQNRGLSQSIFQVGGNIGQALGPLMLPLFLVYTGIDGSWWFIILALIGVLLMYRIVPWLKQRNKEENERKKKGKNGTNRIPSTIVLTLVVIFRSTVVVGISSFLPLYYVNVLDMSVSQASIHAFVFLFAGALGTFCGGPLADRWGNRTIIILSTLLSIPFLLALPYVRGVLAVIVLILLGFCLLSTNAVSVVYGQKLLPQKIGMVSGLMVGLSIGSAGIAATVLGYFADLWGMLFVFSLLAVVLSTGCLLSLFLPTDRVLQD